MLTLLELLTDFETCIDRVKNCSVIWIKGGAKCPLFCAFLTARITHYFGQTAQSLQTRLLSEGELKAVLQTTFLGSEQYYVIKDSIEASSAVQRALNDYLATYSGPHKIIYILETMPRDKLPGIDLTLDITGALFWQLYFFIYGAHSCDRAFAEQLFGTVKTVGLDQAYLFAYYAHLIGRKHAAFFERWIDHIIKPDYSLFMLSQYFFAKDRQNFFALWSKMVDTYPDEFWVSYWGEQLWQTNLFLVALQTKDAALKKLVTRVPFSFTQRDWKKYDNRELANAASFLYGIDYHLKNGSGSNGIDLFCSKFVFNQFSSGNLR